MPALETKALCVLQGINSLPNPFGPPKSLFVIYIIQLNVILDTLFIGVKISTIQIY